MSRRFPSATGPLVGALGGVLVGIVDGIRAGWLAGASSSALLASALLAGSADALLGATAGLLLELVARTTVWGWRVEAPAPTRIVAWVLAGAATAAAGATSVVQLGFRNNRFLAAGLTGLTVVSVAAAGVALAPALARALAFGRGDRRRSPASELAPSALVTIPASLALVFGVSFLLLWKTRAPLHGHVLAVCIARTVAVGAIAPWFIGSSAAVRLRLRWPAAVAIAAVLFVVPAIVALALSWSNNLRFAPWIDIGAGAAIGALALGWAWLLRDRWRQRALTRIALAAAAFVIAVLAWVIVSEKGKSLAP